MWNYLHCVDEASLPSGHRSPCTIVLWYSKDPLTAGNSLLGTRQVGWMSLWSRLPFLHLTFSSLSPWSGWWSPSWAKTLLLISSPLLFPSSSTVSLFPFPLLLAELVYSTLSLLAVALSACLNWCNSKLSLSFLQDAATQMGLSSERLTTWV